MKGLRSVVEVAMEVERMAHISGDWQRRWRERVGLVGFNGCARSVEVEIVVVGSNRWCWLGFLGL